MALPDFDSGVGHSFGLEFDSVVIKQIQEVSGLKKEQDVIEMKTNTSDGKYMIKKLPGRLEGRRGHAHPGPDVRQQLRAVDQELRTGQHAHRPQRRRHHRLRLHGRPDQAVQVGERMAEVARDQQPQGRRHNAC